MDFRELERKMETATLVTFSRLNQIPLISSIYTAWLKDEERCLYVGKSERLKNRIRSHFSGQRGGDQFCLYVYDNFIHQLRPDGFNTAQVNEITAKWIQDKVSFKFVEVPESEIGIFETYLRENWKPILNPL